MNTISQAYLLGIREGRETLKRYEIDGIANLETARIALANCKKCLRMGFAGDMREFIKGERDFWQSQVKREITK